MAPLRQELVAQARATPRFGTAKPYQHDDFGLRLDPADRALAAWIARGDVDEENGCLRHTSGSHRGPVPPHVAAPGDPHDLSRTLPRSI